MLDVRPSQSQLELEFRALAELGKGIDFVILFPKYIQYTISNPYLNQVVLLMDRSGSPSGYPNLTKQHKISENLRPSIKDFGSAFI